MPFRVVAIRAALLVGLFACGTEPETPWVLLRIEDPANVGAPATSLVLTDASGNASTFATQSRVFPITVTLTSKRDGVQIVTIELFDASRLLARGAASVDVFAQHGQEVVLSLDAACKGDACEPVPVGCTSNTECADNLFCNGQEVCDTGVCRSGPAPCDPPSVCDEQSGCVTQPNECTGPHDSSCDDGLICNGTESCVGGQCVAGNPPQNPSQCRTAVCDERNGVRYAFAPDGTPCTPTGSGNGVCYAGACELAPFTPVCHQFARFDVLAEGSILGGASHPITVNDVQFLGTAPSGYDPTWTVTDDDLRPGSTESMGSGNQFALAITADYYLRSFRIRLATASERCTFSTTPASVDGVRDVISTSFTTIMLPIAAEPDTTAQSIRFQFQCDAGVSSIRIDDFCLLERTR